MEETSGVAIIKAILFCEFHHTAGPRISFQVPQDHVQKDIFDAISVYIIPKSQLENCPVTVNVLGHKIIGYPIRLVSSQYERNALHFNLCFVFDSRARTVHYELVVKKLAEHLSTLELESHFLSNEKTKALLPSILEKVLVELNRNGVCSITIDQSTLYLKVVGVTSDPRAVLDHHVPVLTESWKEYPRVEQWDLTTQQILPHIDGVNHIAKIAIDADVAGGLVKACVQNLLYYDVVKLLPVFQYCNIYSCTPKLRNLTTSPELQQRCLMAVAKNERKPPTLRDVFFMYSSMTYGTTVRDLCIRCNPHALRIDELKLIRFGLLNGFIRRIHKYPVLTTPLGGGGGPVDGNSVGFHALCNGIASYDEICCALGMSYSELDSKVDMDSNVAVLWK